MEGPQLISGLEMPKCSDAKMQCLLLECGAQKHSIFEPFKMIVLVPLPLRISLLIIMN